MGLYTFRGGPEEVGRAQGSVDPVCVQEKLGFWMERPHNLENPYFRKNMAFMRREFPDFMEQLEAYGAAAGISDLDLTYYLHLINTGPEEKGCSAFGLLLTDDGPALVRTNDGPHPGKPVEQMKVEQKNDYHLATFPDLKPHGFLGVWSVYRLTVSTSVNDAGLMIGGASGHPKFHWPDNPEHVNLYFTLGLLTQHCADCDDVRHFLRQYRISGVKGITCTAVDARGNILGCELESENVAFREPEDGMLLEVNHWQHPDLQDPARSARPDFWKRDYY